MNKPQPIDVVNSINLRSFQERLSIGISNFVDANHLGSRCQFRKIFPLDGHTLLRAGADAAQILKKRKTQLKAEILLIGSKCRHFLTSG